MRKSELKTGMVIETRRGELGKVLLDTSRGDIIGSHGVRVSADRTWAPLNQWDENLKRVSGTGDPESDILRVWDIAQENMDAASVEKYGKLLWKRPEFKIGEWYKSDLGNLVRYGGPNSGDCSGFLYPSGPTEDPSKTEWSDRLTIRDDSGRTYEIASVKEVVARLIQEGVKRGFDRSGVEFKSSLSCKIRTLTGELVVHPDFEFNLYGEDYQGCVYNNRDSEWAQIIRRERLSDKVINSLHKILREETIEKKELTVVCSWPFYSALKEEYKSFFHTTARVERKVNQIELMGYTLNYSHELEQDFIIIQQRSYK